MRIPPAVASGLLALGLFAATTPLAAQVVRGVVLDDVNLEPVIGASVRLVVGDALDVGTETNAEGSFVLALPGEGEYRLEVQRLGYRTARSQAIQVPSGDTVSVEFRVSPEAILLDPITVTGHSRRGRRAFERRRAEWSRGIFLTPDRIDSIAPRYPADVYRGMDKVVVHWGWGQSSTGGYGPVPSIRTFVGRGCMLYVVDWVPVTPEPWAAQDWNGYQLSSLAAEDIVAVEVYRSVLDVPPELQRYTNRMRARWSQGQVGVQWDEKTHCGLTVFWTRTGW